MPFDRPTLAELIDRVRSDLRGRLSLTGSLARRAMVDVLSAVWAGAVHMLHGHLDWLSKQLFTTTSEREFLILEGSMYGLTPLAATYAAGTILATGVDASVIPEDTIYVRTDGVQYRVTTEATIASGEAEVLVEAVLAGEDGNLDAGETISLESPITGVDADAEVQEVDGEGIFGGEDEESTEAFRTRLLERKRQPPEGGADQDYIAWAKEVAGVTRVWVYRHENGLGTVVVRFVRDDDDDIFPSVGEVAEVQDKLDEERPVTAEVTAEAPVELPVDFTLSITPDTSTVRAAVEAELEDLFFRDGEPDDGDGSGVIFLSRIRTAIGTAAGLDDYTLTTPNADVEPALGELATLGDITWV